MVQVIRERPNLLPLINGVKFEPHPEGSISAPISEEAAQQFLAVPGYRLVEVEQLPEAPAAPAKAERKPRAAAEKAASEAPKAEEPATPAQPAADAGAAEEVF